MMSMSLYFDYETCHNVSEIRDNPEKCVFLTWDDDLNGEFYTALKILVEAEPGIIANIASAVSDAGAAIDRINREERDAKTSVIVLEVGVRDRQHHLVGWRGVGHPVVVVKSDCYSVHVYYIYVTTTTCICVYMSTICVPPHSFFVRSSHLITCPPWYKFTPRNQLRIIFKYS